MKTYREHMQDELRSRVYNALAEIVFETEADEEDMEKALEWFQIRFWEDDEY